MAQQNVQTGSNSSITYQFQNQALPPLSIFYITINNKENAEKLAQILLENKLIACSNIVGSDANPITSVYSWKGKNEKDSEILMILKSRTSLLEEIVQVVKKNHPYEVPEVIATPIIGGNKDYINWVFEQTKEPVNAEL